ncbi:MAG: hypothetical protein KDN19_08330 [Verrucomicrobiae bacterium]|nr:hypothetical protein [Verrucomicrobiae bacterium]
MQIERSKAFRRLLLIAVSLIAVLLVVLGSEYWRWGGFEIRFWMENCTLRLMAIGGFAGFEIDWDTYHSTSMGIEFENSRTSWMHYSSFVGVDDSSLHAVFPIEAWMVILVLALLVGGRFRNTLKRLHADEEDPQV